MHRPADPKLNERAAKTALAVGELERALEYAEAACELDPEMVAGSLTLARVLRRSGQHDKAFEVLTNAARLDPKDSEIQVELKELRRSRDEKE